MQTLTKIYDFAQNLSASFRQHKSAGDARYLQGANLRFELHFELPEDVNPNPNLDFIGQMLEENFSGRVFADEHDPHLDWFKMGEKLGVLKLTVIPHLSYPTLAFQVYQLISGGLCQKPVGVELSEVRIYCHNTIVSYAKKEQA